MSGAFLSSSLFSFASEALPDTDLRVYRFTGHEAISQPFSFKITLVADSADLDLDAPLARPATFCAVGRMHLGIPYTRRVHGRIERFTQLHAGRRYSLYEALLSPTIFPLSHTRNARIFQRLSTVDIVKQILSEAGLPSEQLQTYLHSDYGKRDYCVQYQESDLAFASRLLEEDGIFYFFRHANGHDILVLGDGPHAIESVPAAGHLSHRDQPHLFEDVVHDFRAESTFRPGSTILRDFRFKHPGIDMEARQSAESFADCQVYYYPGEYVDPELGQRIARIRHQELQCQRRSIFAESSCPALLPGHTFELLGHRRHSFNQGYLLTAVEHEGVQPQALKEEHVPVEQASYTNRFRCIPGDVTYRPPRLTARPQILGIQSAVVVGPPGEEIHCDEHGRVKVQFHWDRQGQRNDDSSCWVRSSQTWAGVGYGGTFLPRVGQEVLVQFLEGDPDRPVIVGRVHNGENIWPHGLPGNKNVSAIRTSSTPGSAGFNELCLNDTAGQEEVSLHAQRDLRERILHNHSSEVLNDRSGTVQRNDSLMVLGDQTASVYGPLGAFLHVATQYNVSVGNKITIACGKSSIVMTPDSIDLYSKHIRVDGTELVKIRGGIVKINCTEDAQPSEKEKEEKKKQSFLERLKALAKQLGALATKLLPGAWMELSKHLKGLLDKLHLPSVVSDRLLALFGDVFKDVFGALLQGQAPTWSKLAGGKLAMAVQSGVNKCSSSTASSAPVRAITPAAGKTSAQALSDSATFGVLYAGHLQQGMERDPYWGVVKQQAGPEAMDGFYDGQAQLAAEQHLGPDSSPEERVALQAGVTAGMAQLRQGG